MIEPNKTDFFIWLRKNLKIKEPSEKESNLYQDLDQESVKRKRIWIAELKMLFYNDQFQSVISQLIIRSEKAPLEAYYNIEFSKTYRESGYLANYKKVDIILKSTSSGTTKGQVNDNSLKLSFIKLCSYLESRQL